jgi:hypothetical protein
MDFVDRVIDYRKSYIAKTDEDMQQFSIRKNTQNMHESLELPDDLDALERETIDSSRPIPMSKSKRMYVRSDDGTMDIIDVDFDDSGDISSVKRPYKGPEGPINA